MKRFLHLTILIFFIFCFKFSSLLAQGNSYQIKIMSYNIFDCDNFSDRLTYFNTIMDYVRPDILIVEEIRSSISNVNLFLNNVLKPIDPNYSAGDFIPSSYSENSNAIFYNSSKITFRSNTAIQTNQRDINKFVVYHPLTQDSLIIFALHLHSGDLPGPPSDRTIRASEINYLVTSLDALENNTNYIVVGDFNLYAPTEPAYKKMVKKSNDHNYLIDPVNNGNQIDTLSGTWNLSQYYQVQSLATAKFGRPDATYGCGYQTSGFNYRYDYILMSPQLFNDPDTLKYDDNSFSVFAQDGNHHNSLITSDPTIREGSTIADALWRSSDHLPVLATFTFANPYPVELVNFTANFIKNSVHLNWNTATEVMNYGFDIERSVNGSDWSKIGFINGYGNSNVPHYYTYKDENVDVPGNYKYRLKQIDTDGKFEYSPIAETVVFGPDSYTLSENYPNPFNPTTTIEYQVPTDSKVNLKIIDILGRDIETLVDEEVTAGKHKVIFDASSLSSGIYIYQLRTNDKIITRKMMLLK